MATWLEDVIAALENVGGRGSLPRYSEVQRIRTEPPIQNAEATDTSDVGGSFLRLRPGSRAQAISSIQSTAKAVACGAYARPARVRRQPVRDPGP